MRAKKRKKSLKAKNKNNMRFLFQDSWCVILKLISKE